MNGAVGPGWVLSTRSEGSRTRIRHEGHIQAGGVDRHVTFVNADYDLDDAIDGVYRDTYRP
jgi:hypothetical protein